MLVDRLLMARLLRIIHWLQIVASRGHIFESSDEERIFLGLQKELENHHHHVLIGLKF